MDTSDQSCSGEEAPDAEDGISSPSLCLDVLAIYFGDQEQQCTALQNLRRRVAAMRAERA